MDIIQTLAKYITSQGYHLEHYQSGIWYKQKMIVFVTRDNIVECNNIFEAALYVFNNPIWDQK